MDERHVERLVMDVVLSQADDDEVRDLHSSSALLDVDHLTMTHIVLALETRLGVELPTHLEDARSVAELVAGAVGALRDNGKAVPVLAPDSAAKARGDRKLSWRLPLR